MIAEHNVYETKDVGRASELSIGAEGLEMHENM
jgi:hypothetical protein